jgi:two-component system response regulator YesN
MNMEMTLTMIEESRKPNVNTVKRNGKGDGLVLIAAKPGRLRDALYALLDGMQGINIVGCADDSSSALRMISVHHPALVLLDTNLPGEKVTTVLKRIKTNGAQSRCVILTDTFKQRREALAAGIDAALVKGFRTAELFEIIEGLLSESENL